MTMGSAEFALDMILMKQMAGITNFQTIQTIQAMPEHSDLDGDSTDSSVTNLALEEPEAMQSEAIEKEVISIAGIPAAAAGITVPPGGENKLYEQDQQLQVSEGIKEMKLAEGMSDPFSIEKFTMGDMRASSLRALQVVLNVRESKACVLAIVPLVAEQEV